MQLLKQIYLLQKNFFIVNTLSCNNKLVEIGNKHMFGLHHSYNSIQIIDHVRNF